MPKCVLSTQTRASKVLHGTLPAAHVLVAEEDAKADVDVVFTLFSVVDALTTLDVVVVDLADLALALLFEAAVLLFEVVTLVVEVATVVAECEVAAVLEDDADEAELPADVSVLAEPDTELRSSRAFEGHPLGNSIG